jgi:hypothetical protein
VLGAVVLLPGVASAHHPEFDSELNCANGDYHIETTYFAGSDAQHSGSRNITMYLLNLPDVDQYDGNPSDWENLQITTHEDVNDEGPDFEFDAGDDRFEADNHYYPGPDGFTFFEVDGNYSDIDEFGGFIDGYAIRADINRGFDAQIGVTEDYVGDPLRPDKLEKWEQCVRPICVDGTPGATEDLPFVNPGTGDCDPIRVCVDGQNYSVTEFEQQKGNLQTGGCIPYEPPTPPTPPTTPPTVTTPPAPVQQVAAAVSEVLPARLPSAGMGPDETSSSFSWGAAAAVVLLGLGGMTALMARRQER